jgi:hypothetical protein
MSIIALVTSSLHVLIAGVRLTECSSSKPTHEYITATLPRTLPLASTICFPDSILTQHDISTMEFRHRARNP